MIKDQISLDEKEYALVVREAKARGISVAELVRRAVRQALPQRGTASWMRYIGFVESGDPGSSRKIDELVYDSKDRKLPLRRRLASPLWTAERLASDVA